MYEEQFEPRFGRLGEHVERQADGRPVRTYLECARLLQHIPPLGFKAWRQYGAYSAVTRARWRAAQEADDGDTAGAAEPDPAALRPRYRGSRAEAGPRASLASAGPGWSGPAGSGHRFDEVPNDEFDGIADVSDHPPTSDEDDIDRCVGPPPADDGEPVFYLS